MGKIDEFEQKLIAHGMSEEDFIEYQKLLKRVRGNFLKRQHCYTTAIQFPKSQADKAVMLIKYGLENFEDGWFSTYTSYLFIGHILEDVGDYQKSYDNYLLAKEALGSDHPSEVQELSKDLMWMKLHVDSFKYSTELEEYFHCYENTGDFSKSFINAEFRFAVANIVILMQYGKNDEAKQFLETARKICQPNYAGKLKSILAGHRYYEALHTTPESIAFIRGLKL